MDEIEKTKSRIAEINEEMSLIRSELQNAGIDNHEGKRQQKRAEILENLKRLYPDAVVIECIVNLNKKAKLSYLGFKMLSLFERKIISEIFVLLFIFKL